MIKITQMNQRLWIWNARVQLASGVSIALATKNNDKYFFLLPTIKVEIQFKE